LSNTTIEKLKAGDESILVEIYSLYRNEFLDWAVNNYSCDKEQAKDIFQEAIFGFYSNVRSGRVKELDSGVKTYLFAIGKNHLRNLVKKNSRFTNFPDLGFIKSQIINDMNDKSDQKHKDELIRNAINQLGDDCKKVLNLYYFKNYDMESIAREMGYKNGNVAKKKKFDCLQKLAKLIKKNMLVLVF